MSHYDDIVCNLDKLSECMCLDSCLDSCIFLDSGALSSEEGGLVALLDHGLVTSTPKCKVNRSARHLIILVKIIVPCGNTYTQRNRHRISDICCPDLLKNRKLIRPKLFKVLIIEYQKILILLKLLDNTIAIGNILAYLSLNQSGKERTPEFVYALERFIIIIYIDKPYNNSLIMKLLDILLYIRLIKKINRHQCRHIFYI